MSELCDLGLGKKELSILARQGSGSACRSVHSGFVLWQKGEKEDGSDSYATQLLDSSHWPEFCVLVCVVDSKEKKVSSRKAMQQTMETSPCYEQWVKDSEVRMVKMIEAIKRKDFTVVGTLAEADCLGMHETMRTANPSINYFQDVTLKIIDMVKELRKQGTECYFTIDAGPNVKILCKKKDMSTITQSENFVFIVGVLG